MTLDLFAERHIGPSESDRRAMWATLGYASLDAFIAAVVPADIRLRGSLKVPAAKSEQEALAELRAIAGQNQVYRSYLGMGYHDTYTPGVILRNVLENPGWYTAYTPYQAEIAQGRLEALLALTLLAPPGEWGADIAVGNSQRFGVPLGYGGPHAAFFATRDQYKRHLPGRIIGVSKDAAGRPALRMALQTREQHIRREKATSNVCTAQVLLAVTAAMYAVYHGPDGLRRIAEQVHGTTRAVAGALKRLGYRLAYPEFFDTLAVEVDQGAFPKILEAARAKRINLRSLSPTRIGVALDETTSLADVNDVAAAFALGKPVQCKPEQPAMPRGLARTSPFCTHPVFNAHHSETEMLRYLKRLEDRDLSLTSAMIPLGSCTMKLNATTEMIPVTWPEFGRLHPFAPREQARGYTTLFQQLEGWLAEITAFAKVSR